VPNATQISPEEMGALGQKSSDLDKEETLAASTEEPTPEAPKAKEDPLSSQFATLARKERALRAQIQQFKAEQAKYQEERNNAPKPQETDLSRYIERDRLKSDPLAVFAEAGLSYDEIVEQVMAQSSIQTDPRLKAQIAKMESEIKAAREEAKSLRDAQENEQKNSYQQAVSHIRAEAGKLVFTDPNFEMIKATNSVSDVVELIEETFKADGTLLSVEEACQAVEDHLLEEAMKLTKVKKLQQRLAAPAAPQKPVTKSEQPQTGSKTLTNTMSASKPMSAKERAIAAFNRKLP
jgi:outer membrane murein-binding lipoprotein Lpp